MGLDMYLTAKKYLWSDADQELSEKINGLIGVEPSGDRFNDASMRVKGISMEAMYWRKANAIHNWFVENVQDGTDDCKEYEVSLEQLEKLKDLCNFVLENPDDRAEEHLPTAEGFLFGNTEYKEWYLDDLRKTVNGLNKSLDLDGSWDFYYQSSW